MTESIAPYIQGGALGLLALVIVGAIYVVLKFAPQIVDAITGIGSSLSEQMDRQDTRHREERKELAGVISGELRNVTNAVHELRDEVHEAIRK